MTDDRIPVPLLVLGAAGAFTLAAALVRPRAARAASASTPTRGIAFTPPRIPPATGAPASPAAGAVASPVVTPLLRFEFGRPLPADVRAVVSSGWLEARDERLHRGLDIGASIGTPILAIDHGEVTRVVRVDRSAAGLWVAVKHPSGVSG